jgi:hypothetical protein
MRPTRKKATKWGTWKLISLPLALCVATAGLSMWIAQQISSPSHAFAILVPVVINKYDWNIESIGAWPKACQGSHKPWKPDLVFQVNNLNGLSKDTILSELRHSIGENRKCFNTIYLSNVNLRAEDDVYPTAANKMFFSGFADAQQRGYEAFFWMEHDVRPITENWLDKLYKDVVSHETNFVMLGSIPQNKDWASYNLAAPHNFMDHINGAALYSLTQDSIELFDYVKHFHTKYPSLAWDAMIAMIFNEWRANGNIASWDMRVKYACKYRYHEFVYNNIGSNSTPAKYPKGTIFVHGNTNSTGNQLYPLKM